jgi:hypothetical protein
MLRALVLFFAVAIAHFAAGVGFLRAPRTRRLAART